MRQDPVWSCSEEDGYYLIEVTAKAGCFRHLLQNSISKFEFDGAWCKKALIENSVERMMDELRKIAFKYGNPQEFLGNWPKQKYDIYSITCIQS